MKTISELIILFWIVQFIYADTTVMTDAQQAFGTIAFVVGLLLHLIVFYNRSSSAPSDTRTITGTR